MAIKVLKQLKFLRKCDLVVRVVIPISCFKVLV